MKLALAATLLLLLAQTSASTPPAEIALPEAADITAPLGKLLQQRQSTRRYAPDRELSHTQLATLLWAMTGVNRPDPADVRGGKRTVPSAYGSCAVDVLITSAAGTYRYDPAGHALVPFGAHGKTDLRKRLTGSDWAQVAPVLVALVANLDRYPERVRPETRREYAHADAAVIGQNLYLAAGALGLGTVITDSAPRDADGVLGLSEDQFIVFVMPLGYPAG